MSDKLPMDFGNYVLLDLIARGGMAEIYRAKMKTGIDGFEKAVAIKKILPNLAENDEFITMLIDEARISVTMNHSNIAQVYDLGRVGDSYYIAMEYIPGVDLSTMIKILGKKGYLLPLDHAIFVTKELCAGLYYAHSKKDEDGNNLGVVHRDISPHNVLVSFNGNVKVIDFGVAKASVKLGQTRMGVIKGKLLYMAPEQAMAKHIDCRADIFSAGLCLYRMLTGRLPFEAESEFQIYNNVLTADVTPPIELNPDIPQDLNDVVMKSLERDLDKRYADGWLMHQDLERVLHRISPGYTMNRLSRFMDEQFSAQKPAPIKHNHRSSSNQVQPAHGRPSTPSMPSVGSGQYGGNGHAPNTPSNWKASVPVSHPVSTPGYRGSNPSIPAAQNPSAPPLPSPEDLGFKPRTEALDHNHGYDADPTVDMQIDEDVLQKMAEHARRHGRPKQNKTQIDDTASKIPKPAHGNTDPKSKMPLVLVLGALLLLVVIGAGGFAAWSILGDETQNPTQPVVTPTPKGKTSKPPVAQKIDPKAAFAKATPLVAAAHQKASDLYSANVHLTLKSEPSGATILLGREKLGETPATVLVPRSEDPVEIQFQLKGYQRASKEIIPNLDRKASVTLASTKKGNDARPNKPNTQKNNTKPNNTKPSKSGKNGGNNGGGKDNNLLDPW